jgi:hypothetical protein
MCVILFFNDFFVIDNTKDATSKLLYLINIFGERKYIKQ